MIRETCSGKIPQCPYYCSHGEDVKLKKKKKPIFPKCSRIKLKRETQEKRKVSSFQKDAS